jgi:arylsulfatase A-like enzyme
VVVLSVLLVTPAREALSQSDPAERRLQSPRSRSRKTLRRPNVLFISIDDLNDWIGALEGHPQTRTPNIDRLAARGVLFANAHSQAPICNPSRTSVMTGLLPSTTGIYENWPGPRYATETGQTQLLHEYFKSRRGYWTMGAGKVFHGSFPMTATFDVYGPQPGFGPFPERKLIAPGEDPLWDWGAVKFTDAEMGDGQVAQWAADRLRRGPRRPFFMAIGFHRPHMPMYAPKRWFANHPDEDDIIPPPAIAEDRDDLPEIAVALASEGPGHEYFLRINRWRKAVRSYLACVSFVDSCVGVVLDALEESGLADSTIIVLWSDQGFHLGEKGHWGKRTLWERSTRVPLIVVAPGATTAGLVSTRPVGLIDIYPTLLELANMPENPALEGLSLVRWLRHPGYKRPSPVISTLGRGSHALRDDDWRYIRYADGSEELYDHREDPHEWHNLAGDPAHAEVIERMRAHLPKDEAEDAREHAEPPPDAAAAELEEPAAIQLEEPAVEPEETPPDPEPDQGSEA